MDREDNFQAMERIFEPVTKFDVSYADRDPVPEDRHHFSERDYSGRLALSVSNVGQNSYQRHATGTDTVYRGSARPLYLQQIFEIDREILELGKR
jgi:hypothetical protein